jgi:hypothetical protein
MVKIILTGDRPHNGGEEVHHLAKFGVFVLLCCGKSLLPALSSK